MGPPFFVPLLEKKQILRSAQDDNLSRPVSYFTYTGHYTF